MPKASSKKRTEVGKYFDFLKDKYSGHPGGFPKHLIIKDALGLNQGHISQRIINQGQNSNSYGINRVSDALVLLSFIRRKYPHIKETTLNHLYHEHTRTKGK